jgi:hypothetical protein
MYDNMRVYAWKYTYIPHTFIHTYMHTKQIKKDTYFLQNHNLMDYSLHRRASQKKHTHIYTHSITHTDLWTHTHTYINTYMHTKQIKKDTYFLQNHNLMDYSLHRRASQKKHTHIYTHSITNTDLWTHTHIHT